MPKIKYVLLFILILNTNQVLAMGFFDFFTIHVFSPVTGVVTLNGEPVEGAEVIRTADHEEDKVYSDKAFTDKGGRFGLNGISTFSLRPIMLPTIINQKIIINYKGVDYLAWETTKRNNHKYGELNDADTINHKKFKLNCELTDDQEKYEIVELRHGNRGVTGLCRWG